MKKSFLMFAIAALALASCSQDEPVSVNKGRQIDFRPAMGTLSRGTEITNANLSDITVTALLGDQTLFKDITFSKNGGFYTSSPEYYWPGDDSQLDFYAYAPAAPGGNITIDSQTKTMTDFSPAGDIADQVDFISSYATGKKSENEASGVELTFDHRLSQIEIQGKTDNDAYTFKVMGVRIGQPVSKGSFDFSTDAWTLSTASTDRALYESTYNDTITLGSEPVTLMAKVAATGASDNAMLIPQELTAWDPTADATNTANGAYLAVKLQIKTTETGAQVYPFPSDGNCIWAAVPIDNTWEAGKKYIYVLDFTHGAGYVDPHDPQPGTPILGGPIKFTVNVTDWVSETIDKDMKTYQGEE